MLHIFVLLFFFVVTQGKRWGPGARTPGPRKQGSMDKRFFLDFHDRQGKQLAGCGSGADGPIVWWGRQPIIL